MLGLDPAGSWHFHTVNGQDSLSVAGMLALRMAHFGKVAPNKPVYTRGVFV